MKLSFRISIIALTLLISLPYYCTAAIAKQNQSKAPIAQSRQITQSKRIRHHHFKEKIREHLTKFKLKMQHWKKSFQMRFPTGKLLACLVFLVLSIVFFAVAGVTTLGVLFNALGSAAVIAALVIFVLWLSERKNTPLPTD
ncbi:MAG: hypothetical protein GC192_10435 [Bacteroidetes bacterium]|nr:hypothetical protein [Bacteroidota bacterium]